MSNHLRLRRKELDLTLEEVAKAVGSTKATIMKLETGAMNLTESWMKRLAVPLQCDPADFIAEEWPADVPIVGLVMERDTLALYRSLPSTGLGEAENYWRGLEVVDRPPEGGYRQVIALRLQNDDFEPFLAAGSIIYAAEPIEKGFERYLNQIVICRLQNGAVSIKKLKSATSYGKYRLESICGEEAQETKIDWCAKVIFFKPA